MNVLSRRLSIACWLIGMAGPVLAQAQAPSASAQQIYESDIALCNGAATPAPVRDACVRAAGDRLDRARGGTPTDVTVTSPDGRATVVSPQGATPPPTSSDTVPSRDGRANVVPNR